MDRDLAKSIEEVEGRQQEAEAEVQPPGPTSPAPVQPTSPAPVQPTSATGGAGGPANDDGSEIGQFVNDVMDKGPSKGAGSRWKVGQVTERCTQKYLGTGTMPLYAEAAARWGLCLGSHAIAFVGDAMPTGWFERRIEEGKGAIRQAFEGFEGQRQQQRRARQPPAGDGGWPE